jgi:hypothetical protein
VRLPFSAFAVSLVAGRLVLGHVPDRLGSVAKDVQKSLHPLASARCVLWLLVPVLWLPSLALGSRASNPFFDFASLGDA